MIKLWLLFMCHSIPKKKRITKCREQFHVPTNKLKCAHVYWNWFDKVQYSSSRQTFTQSRVMYFINRAVWTSVIRNRHKNKHYNAHIRETTKAVPVTELRQKQVKDEKSCHDWEGIGKFFAVLLQEVEVRASTMLWTGLFMFLKVHLHK